MGETHARRDYQSRRWGVTSRSRRAWAGRPGMSLLHMTGTLLLTPLHTRRRVNVHDADGACPQFRPREVIADDRVHSRQQTPYARRRATRITSSPVETWLNEKQGLWDMKLAGKGGGDSGPDWDDHALVHQLQVLFAPKLELQSKNQARRREHPFSYFSFTHRLPFERPLISVFSLHCRLPHSLHAVIHSIDMHR